MKVIRFEQQVMSAISQESSKSLFSKSYRYIHDTNFSSSTTIITMFYFSLNENSKNLTCLNLTTNKTLCECI